MHSSTGGSSSGTPSTHPSRLKISELLIMSICLAFCINARIDYLATSGSSSNSPELTSGTHTQESTGFQSKYSIDELSAILEDNFKRAIYYYHMILVISDSISTVIAILFMITFVENTYLATHINTQLIAVAVRYAQEFGLHRSETYEGLSKEDNQLRQRVWVICRTLDTEICFRSGKPALVNVSDISSEFDDELLQKLKYQASLVTSSLTTTPLETPNVGSESTNSSSVSELAYSQKEVIHRYLLMEFTRIRSSSYNKLFVDSVKTISFDSLIEIIDEINKDMFKMVDVIPLDIKPRFFYDPNFAQAIGKIDSSYWATQLAYFFHLMLINRIPSVINPISNDGNGKSSSRNMHTANNSSKENKEKDNLPETEEDIDKITKVNRYLNISLNSARTILILVENVFTGVGVSASDEGKSIPKSVVTWNIFYPFAAFLYLLGNTIDNYNSPDCLNDATLLINSSIKFFNYMNRSESSKIRNQKNKVVDLAVRILMNILLKYLQIYRNVNFFDTFPGLKQYLEGTDDLFPEIFRKEKVRKELLAYSYRMTDISALQRDSFENHGVSGLPVPILNHTNQQSPPLQKHNNMPLPRQPIPQHTYTLPPLQPQQVPEQVPMSSSSQSPGANEPPSESYRPHLLYQVLNRPPQPPQNIVPQIPVTLPPPTPRQVPAQGSWMPMNQHQVHGPLQVPGAAPVPITVGGPTPISNTGQLPMEYPQEYLPYDPQSLQEQLLAGNVDDISDSIFHSQVFGLSNLFFDKNT